jgi:alkanesulfonate monooxygenase SsuD/methylene tetrahydromethanopterin reductase-like flavin-dependent oxidoreductase (luciferase family)
LEEAVKEKSSKLWKYADVCNLFGSPETLKNKLEVLKDHCKSVGRDYDSILKTKLGTIVVDDDTNMAKNRVQENYRGMSKEQIKEFVIYGTPEDIQRQIEALEQVGIQYLIVNFESSRELKALDIFANKIITKMSTCSGLSLRRTSKKLPSRLFG